MRSKRLKRPNRPLRSKRRISFCNFRQVSQVRGRRHGQKGIGSVLSTRNFASQRYTFVKHPESFFSKRPKTREEIRKMHCEINTEADYLEKLDTQYEFILELKTSIPKGALLLFQKLQLLNVVDKNKLPYFCVDISPIGKMVKIRSFSDMVENSVKVERMGNPRRLRPSQLFGSRPPLAPKVVHTPNPKKQMSVQVTPRFNSQVAIHERKSGDDDVVSAISEAVEPIGEQSQQKRELSFSSSGSELELPWQERGRSKSKRQKLSWNSSEVAYTVCFPGCLEERKMEDVMVTCKSVDQCRSKAPFGMFHASCWREISDPSGLCKFCMESS